MDQVINNLYIGGISGANDYNLLKRNGITHIVSCQPAYVHDNITYHNVHIPYCLNYCYTPKGCRIMDKRVTGGSKRILIPTVDDDIAVDIYSHFYNAVDFIDSALSKNGKVFVHCYAGISRSASIILAYLMAIKKYTLEDAHDLLLSKRKICDPNPGFMLQLTCFEWALSLVPKSYVTNQIIKGPVFNEIQFDIANYEVLFCEDLETMYDGCIFIDRCHMPQFRPVITSNIIYNYCKGYCDEIYQLDILELLKQHSKPTAKPTPRRILIVSTNDNILVLAYWNLLYRSGMSYDESFKYFKQNASIELNNAFDGNTRTILYPYTAHTEF